MVLAYTGWEHDQRTTHRIVALARTHASEDRRQVSYHSSIRTQGSEREDQTTNNGYHVVRAGSDVAEACVSADCHSENGVGGPEQRRLDRR